jgi:hypothetical protein
VRPGRSAVFFERCIMTRRKMRQPTSSEALRCFPTKPPFKVVSIKSTRRFTETKSWPSGAPR